MEKKEKTLFVTSFHSIISKNILNSDVFNLLRSDKNLKIIVFVPQHKKELFEKYYSGVNVIFEGINPKKLVEAKINIFFARLSLLLVDSHYLWYKKVEKIKLSKSLLVYIKYLYKIYFTKLFASSSLAKKIFRFFDYNFISKSFLSDYFDKYKPDFIFVTDVFDSADTVFLREARYRKVYSVGMVRSWDNCHSKGLLRSVPNKLIVNNKTIKDDAVSLHLVPEKNIFIGGLPQFDNLLKEKRLSREDFYKNIGADINKRLIMFSPLGYPLSDTDWQILQIFKDALNNKKFPIIFSF